ncbi:MAG TPA: biotin--[acetyl-CoA-carboxylase] ligase, partial [Pseudomonadales bacterium]|nr:biotin--[acetyl-CoA-carboxylase] ligase [Pseudomonadales bacterium]
EKLGISRAAIWKRIQRITDELGVPVQSVPGKGYRIAQPLRMLNRDAIQYSFPTLPIFLYNSIDSTNDEAKKLLSTYSAPLAVFAEHQTQGKGRRGREWSSPYAQNLYLSFVWPITEGLDQIDGLSLVIGLAVLKTIKRVCKIEAQLKWPNDVLINERKVAGILLELIGDPVELCHVVIGVGVNINMLDSVFRIDQEWTSLAKETGAIIDRELFAKILLEELDIYLDRQKIYGFSSMRAEWLSAHAWQGRNVVLHTGNDFVDGKLIGVGDKGEVCLLVDGQEYKYLGGELSLRLQNDTRN